MIVQGIQALAQANGGVAAPGASGASGTGASGGFAGELTKALQAVNNTANQSALQGINLSAGTAPSLSNVLISVTKAQLAVELTVQVRNRVISAYNQVMNMQV